MALTLEAERILQAQIVALKELPIVRIIGVLGGANPAELSPLYRPCKPVPITPEGLRGAQTVVDQMGAVLRLYHEITGTGRALAANQIGIGQAITVFLNQSGEIATYLNPRSTWASAEQNVYWEICISGSPLGVDVVRPASVRVRWDDLKGQQHEELLEGFDARRMQHEIEHVDGGTCYTAKGADYRTLGYGLNPQVYMNQSLRPVNP